MRKFDVEVNYITKRGGIALGVTVEAKDSDEAMQIAKDKVIKGYPRRKWAYTVVRDV